MRAGHKGSVAASPPLVCAACGSQEFQIRRLERSAGLGGFVRVWHEGNEAVAPPVFAIGIASESAWRSAGLGGFVRA